MIAWHGSPVLFDRFESGKITHGSEGFGIYVTEHREMACSYAVPGIWRTTGAPRHGHVYEVETPDGEYIDNSMSIDDQPAVARAILLDAIDRLSGPRAGYCRFVIADEGNYNPDWSQVGRALFFARQSGIILEPVLAAAGYAGCMYNTEKVSEFSIFNPSDLRILSVTPYERRVAA